MTDANGGDVEDLIKSAPPETASSGIVVGGETDHPVKDFKSAPVVAGGETDPVKKLFAIGIVTFVVALVVGVKIGSGSSWASPRPGGSLCPQTVPSFL